MAHLLALGAIWLGTLTTSLGLTAVRSFGGYRQSPERTKPAQSFGGRRFVSVAAGDEVASCPALRVFPSRTTIRVGVSFTLSRSQRPYQPRSLFCRTRPAPFAKGWL